MRPYLRQYQAWVVLAGIGWSTLTLYLDRQHLPRAVRCAAIVTVCLFLGACLNSSNDMWIGPVVGAILGGILALAIALATRPLPGPIAHQFGIRDLLMLTFVVALILSMGGLLVLAWGAP